MYHTYIHIIHIKHTYIPTIMVSLQRFFMSSSEEEEEEAHSTHKKGKEMFF